MRSSGDDRVDRYSVVALGYVSSFSSFSGLLGIGLGRSELDHVLAKLQALGQKMIKQDVPTMCICACASNID